MLDTLPPEMLDQILTYCDQPSLKVLRLSSKHVNHRSTALLYSSLHVGFFICSLHRLRKITTCSALAKNVKDITFHPDILPRKWDKEAWLDAIDFRPAYSEWKLHGDIYADAADRTPEYFEYVKLPHHDLDETSVEAGWRCFNTFSREQWDWREHREGIVLKECLSSLPNLQSASIRSAKPFQGGRLNDTPYWKSIAKSILVGPDAWAYEQSEPTVLSDGADTEYSVSARYGLPALSMLEAIGYRSTFFGLKAFESLQLELPVAESFQEIIGCTRHVQGHYEEAPHPTNEISRYNLIVDAFRSLQHLALICPHAADYYAPGSPKGAQAEEVQNLLRAATQLKTLELEYGDAEKKDYDDWREHFGLSPLFSSPAVIWPYLHTLSITASIPSRPFVNFLTLHGPTLKRLEMRDNVSDNWRAVLEAVPKACRLEYVYLECLWQWDAGAGRAEDDGEAEDEDEDDDEGMYICHFDEGTDVDNAENEEIKAFLLRGEGTLDIYSL